MKWLFCVAAAVCIFNVDASEFVAPKGLISKEDIEHLESWYIHDGAENTYDTEPLKQELRQRVAHDDIAKGAMELFIGCKYWHLVDYCEEFLLKMNNENSQLFREVLALSAPWLDIGNYTDRVVNLIGDPLPITADYFQNRDFIFDMFYCGAIETARLGYCWLLTETCAAICDELWILAETFKWPEYERFKVTNVRRVAYSGRRTEDILRATATEVWPNLPDAETWRSWDSDI